MENREVLNQNTIFYLKNHNLKMEDNRLLKSFIPVPVIIHLSDCSCFLMNKNRLCVVYIYMYLIYIYFLNLFIDSIFYIRSFFISSKIFAHVIMFCFKNLHIINQ